MMMVKGIRWIVLVAALTVCLSLTYGPQSCDGLDWTLSRMRKSIGDGMMRPYRWLTGGNDNKNGEPGRDSANDADADDGDSGSGDDDDGKEHFEAMCMMSREPSLKGPPEVMFFSKKSHSRSTFGCSEGQATFKLNSSSLESSQSEMEDGDNDLRRQLIHGNLYNGSLSTYFIIHGFMASWESTWMCDLKDLILNGSEANVFIVDWSGGAYPMLPIDYGKAVTNTKLVAGLLANFIKSLQRVASSPSSAPDLGHFHLIGHSLGGQISGFVGYSLEGQLGRITALDPAGPCFSQQRRRSTSGDKDASVEGYLDGSDRRRLSASSAKLVIALHTDCSLFGLDENCAHYDIYVNGGHRQPDCGIQSASQLLSEIIHANLANKIGNDITCGHSYGHDLIETFDDDGNSDADWLEAKCYPMAYECSSWESFYAGECGFCLDHDAKCVFVGLNRNILEQKSIAPTILSNSANKTSSSGFMEPPQNRQGSNDCRFNGEWNCGGNGAASNTISFLSSRINARASILSVSSSSRSSSSSSSASSPNYLISSARHFMRSGNTSPHCVYHYQVLIATRTDEGGDGADRKYQLRIPLRPSGNGDGDDGQRIVQVSNKIDKNTSAYYHIRNNYLATMGTVYEPLKKLAHGPSDYYSALITFQPDCSTQDSQSLCRPIESLEGAELWSADDTPVKGVQWVAINFMSSHRQATRIKYSHILQVGKSNDQRNQGNHIRLQKVSSSEDL